MLSNHQGANSDNFVISNDSSYRTSGLHCNWSTNTVLQKAYQFQQWPVQMQQTQNYSIAETSTCQVNCQQYNHQLSNQWQHPIQSNYQSYFNSTSYMPVNSLNQRFEVPMQQQPVSSISNLHLAPNSNLQSSPSARITFTTNSIGGFKAAAVKRKRKRTMFKTEQVEYLENVFSKKPYVNREERQAIAETLQISDKAVKVWFQNRRIRGKREIEQAQEEYCESDYSPNEESYYSPPKRNCLESARSELSEEDKWIAELVNPVYEIPSNSSSSEDSLYSSAKTSPLDYLESELNRKIDESGYVTLDDKALASIITVIDNVLSRNNFKLDLTEVKTDCFSSNESSDQDGSASISHCEQDTSETENHDEISSEDREISTSKSTSINGSFSAERKLVSEESRNDPIKDNESHENEIIESEGSTYEGSIYEPISPASPDIADEEAPRWKNFAPEESLQRLFDLHFC